MTTAPVFACSNSVSALSDAELLDALRDREIERRRAYDQLRLIAEIDMRGVAVARGYRDVAALVREMFAVNPADARRMVTHARQLNPRVAASGARIEAELPVVADALADGVIGPEHVEAIHAAVRALPPAASIEDRVMAEKILCEAAVVSEPRIVARLGREIRQRLDPDGDPPRDEDAALPRRRLDISERHGGGVAGSFDLDAETGALLTALLSPLTEPRAGADGPDLRSPAERRGDAFAEVLRLAARCPDVPTEAGEPATLLVSVTLDQLRSGLGHGLLDGHEMLSAAQIRRLACDAKVVPVVLGSKSETLDVGRATRVVPRRIRRALIRRDKGCTFPSCARKGQMDRSPSRHPLGPRRAHLAGEPHPAVQPSSPPAAPHRLANPHDPRPPLVHPTRPHRPDWPTPAQHASRDAHVGHRSAGSGWPSLVSHSLNNLCSASAPTGSPGGSKSRG